MKIYEVGGSIRRNDRLAELHHLLECDTNQTCLNVQIPFDSVFVIGCCTVVSVQIGGV